MEESLIQTLPSEAVLRPAIAVGLLALLTVWELAAPDRRAEVPRLFRWTNNIALVVLDAVVVRLLLPVSLAAFAAQMQGQGWGLFALFALPGWVAFALAFLLFDLAIWAQHRVFHAVPLLWRLHRVHHADLHVDASTGLRFHPVEILLSLAIKLALIAVLGPPALAILVFEIALNATSLFSHANISLSARIDGALRWVLVTPAMHRTHHSWHRDETDSNFGFCLPWWDRLFGTYRPQPRQPLTVGLQTFRSAGDTRLDRMLAQPLHNGADPG